MNADLETIKKRIKKLLALSKSSNENEAMAALQKAQELMEAYHVTEAECVYTSQAVKTTKRESAWRATLANPVASLYACVALRDVSSGQMIFYGEAFDAFMAKEMYGYLSKTIDRMVKQNVCKRNTLKYKNQYRFGIACRLAIRIYELGQQVSWAPEREHKLLAAKKAAENEFGIITRNKLKTNHKDKAFNRGVADGGTVSLHRQATARNGYLEG
ncbi:DUF2786 domain-containing protein [Treponema phagedenis]|uniref:DUF2786 domain-containing protein n=1 Tax=Treponema phagedenis TaxID=162 RepID=A0AAE6IWL5_TREPH|nr:DUF2786 domain-containing protein [Treponema phagedenis]QEJ99483.1 DUF2786 domain-containing protein [Treponema phagedenis]QEK05054.1 DUF2786 domain-containing protein [Treponema phagedenis]QEK10675.1 DUF2786 domain-containing protein [Treponema phagedenis]